MILFLKIISSLSKVRWINNPNKNKRKKRKRRKKLKVKAKPKAKKNNKNKKIYKILVIVSHYQIEILAIKKENLTVIHKKVFQNPKKKLLQKKNPRKKHNLKKKVR